MKTITSIPDKCLSSRKLTCRNKVAVAIPLNRHGWISDGSNLGLKVGAFALVDSDVLERGREARCRVFRCHLFLRLLLRLSLHMFQVDHFWFSFFPAKVKYQ